MENADSTSFGLRALRCHFFAADKERPVRWAATAANNLYLPPYAILTHEKLLFFLFFFLFLFFLIYKKRLVLESVLRKMINASAGLSQDVAQWLVLVKRLQVNSGFWLHCGENKWGVCDASYVTMKEPPDRELQGMNPHVLHLFWAHVHAVYHTHKHSEIIHMYTRLPTWKITVWVRAAIFFFIFFIFKAQTGLCYSFGNTGSENLSTTHWIEVFFLFFFFFLKWEACPVGEEAMLAGEKIPHEWKRCSVSLRLAQSPSRRWQHNGPQCASHPSSDIKHR